MSRARDLREHAGHTYEDQIEDPNYDHGFVTARERHDTPRTERERDIEAYLVRRVKAAGGTCNKVEWIGRRNAPDRLVTLPPGYAPGKLGTSFWVELKNPETIKTFPANAHERAQHREHERMRECGMWVEVIGTRERIDGLFQ